MNFQKSDQEQNQLRLKNRLLWWLNHLWPLPTHPNRLSSYRGDADIQLSVNAYGFSVNYPRTDARFQLDTDTGGFLPEFAGAFNLVNGAKITELIARNTSSGSTPGNLYVPFSIASSLGWRSGENIADHSVCLIPDQPWRETMARKSTGIFPAWIRRCLISLPVILGQMLIFAVPLSLFGILSFVLGEAALISAGLLLASVWNISKSSGRLKGFLLGLAVGLLLMIGTYLTAGNLTEGALKLATGFILCSTWIGWVFDGITSV